uniref:Protein tyrosine phosphatase receptor type C n=1 Tax=Macaca nemestrina TaxID=9545 RepID=A0A2K6BN00_MACNE
MTMCLWLKLLAFGFAFLDTEVFVTGNPTIGCLQAEEQGSQSESQNLTSREADMAKGLRTLANHWSKSKSPKAEELGV